MDVRVLRDRGVERERDGDEEPLFGGVCDTDKEE